MSDIIRVLSFVLATALPIQGNASIVVLDPSTVIPDTDVTNYFDGVTLLTASGTVDIDGITVIQPLQLLSGSTAGVIANGVHFEESGSSSPYYWSAGPCCGRDGVLRANFANPVFEVSVDFFSDDTDTAILQGYDSADALVSEAIYRTQGWFTTGVSSASGSISYILATFSDTGKIGKISYVAAAPIPEPSSYVLFMAGLGIIGLMTRRRLDKTPDRN